MPEIFLNRITKTNDDETSCFTGKTSAKTLREFLDSLPSNESGEVTLYLDTVPLKYLGKTVGYRPENGVTIGYNRGDLDVYEQVLEYYMIDIEISENLDARGGWGQMNYSLYRKSNI